MRHETFKKVFDLLVEQQRAKVRQIGGLFEKHASLEEKEGAVVGRVTKLHNGDIVLLPIRVFSHDNMIGGKRIIPARNIYHIAENSTQHQVRIGDRAKDLSTQQIYLEPPKRIFALQYNRNTVEFSIQPVDRDLDKLLKEYNSPIESLEDLKKLTKIISRKIGFEKAEHEYNDTEISLGKAITKFGAKCRHLAALEYAILKLQDKSAQIVHTDDKLYPGIDEMHSFLHVRIGNDTYAVDPTHNIIVPLKDLMRYLAKIKKPKKYHHNAKPVRFKFDYD